MRILSTRISPPFQPIVFTRPSRCAVAMLIRAALSQVSFVSGFASSCSQPLLAKRPSKIVGSVRKTIWKPVSGDGWGVLVALPGVGIAGVSPALAEAELPGLGETVFTGSALF